MSDDKRKRGARASGLLGDLESIRSLLEENGPTPSDDPVEPAAANRDRDVPLLEDVVHGGVSLSETFEAGQGDFVDSPDASGLNEEIFKALLSSKWRDSARELLDDARSVIEQHQTEWTPEHTDELNAALKVRIDETLRQWLEEIVRSRIDELRQALLDAVGEQIKSAVDERFNPLPRHDEDPDGE